jgi:hypothetical protein
LGNFNRNADSDEIKALGERYVELIVVDVEL